MPNSVSSGNLNVTHLIAHIIFAKWWIFCNPCKSKNPANLAIAGFYTF